ncbi:MAG TPA: enolase C-terminal domain-like protein [Burkholderiales bacterium]|nr:enolase C-terminal domain-like protein [Burkholderiales bacterium]
MKIHEIRVHQLALPLRKPYRVSFRTYTALEPIIVEMRGADGETGWGEAYIPPGSTFETPESGWAFCTEQAAQAVGLDSASIAEAVEQRTDSAPFAATALSMALAMLERHPALAVAETHRVPLLVPVSAQEDADIAAEVETLLDAGYRTLKVKVGWDVDDDLRRVRAVQSALAGRGEITMDANRGYDRAQGCAFASSLNPVGIALFEQPCGADDWDANSAVAKVSTVPLMLDESIRNTADIARAATIDGVELVKLKMKRLGGIDRTIAAMQRAQQAGLGVCLGDGVATELLCWAEACIGRPFLERAGDMNGFLKPKVRLFREPLEFDGGALVLKAGFWPDIDRGVLEAHTVRTERYARATAAA